MKELFCKSQQEYDELIINQEIINQLVEEINYSQLKCKINSMPWTHIHHLQDSEDPVTLVAAAQYISYVSDICGDLEIEENGTMNIKFCFKSINDSQASVPANYKSPFDEDEFFLGKTNPSPFD